MVFADQGEIISGGNFHGEYPAKVLDYLAIGVHELANMSERRTERLVNPGTFCSYVSQKHVVARQSKQVCSNRGSIYDRGHIVL